METSDSTIDARQASAVLLDIVQQLTRELHPGHKLIVAPGLDSTLDKDLGFDSLGRMELLTRLESAFGVRISESAMVAADTPRELLRILLSSSAARQSPDQAVMELAVAPDASGTPEAANTLLDVLDWHIQAHRDRTHIVFYAESERPLEISYADLLQGASVVAGGLRQRGLMKGQAVAIMLPSGKDYFSSFFGILLAGGVPVPIYPPVRLSQIEEHLRRHVMILDNALAAFLITVPEARTVARFLQAQLDHLQDVISVDELQGVPPGEVRTPIHGHDLAFLQYTSGSTGTPKGVALTHANLLTNVRAMGSAVQVDSTDVFVSWLPLYHDMGLIGAWLGSLYYASPLVLMSPLSFLARPQRWLWAIHRHRGTLSAAPNFAYELCLNKIADEDIEGLDLSSWRMAFNGAEPVSPRTLERFYERFRAYGLGASVMTPVYGLAENSVGLAFPPVGRGPLIDRVRRKALSESGKALPAAQEEMDALDFASCGRVLPGHEIRIVDKEGRVLPERTEGYLQFRGPSATNGYFRNPSASMKLFDGAWLNSDDLAYMAGGEVYLTGRSKDIIIRAGRNIHPYEVEDAVGEIAGVRKGCVAVFGSMDAAAGTERLVIVAESRDNNEQVLAEHRKNIGRVVTDLLGTPPDDVLVVPPHTVLKTSSGKIRRAATRERYQSGTLVAGSRAVWRQFLSLGLLAARSQLLRASKRVKPVSYGAYAWTLFISFAVPVWLLVAVLPKRRWRWWIMRRAAHLLASLVGVSIERKGMENLPLQGNSIYVANHASYLDGVFLVAALPGMFHFVAKSELQAGFVARIFLQKIGCEFVQRFDAGKGAADSRRISDVASRGRSLMFFPEGTFQRQPGILPFYMGAFVTAAENDLPVVPVVISGTRRLLPAGTWLPGRADVSLTAGEVIYPADTSWSAAVDLRDRSREQMLHLSGEADTEKFS